MRHRRVFLSVCLIGSAFGADGVAQTLGRPPAPAARGHDWSYGTWTDLPDAWGYFPPSSIAERQKMLAWAERVRREAAVLDRWLASRPSDDGQSAEIEAVRAVRYEAESLKQELLFGSHMADLRPRLGSLKAAIDAVALRESTNPQVKRWVESGDRDLEKIVKHSGPWPREPLADRRRGFAHKTTEPGEEREAAGEGSDRSSPRP